MISGTHDIKIALSVSSDVDAEHFWHNAVVLYSKPGPSAPDDLIQINAVGFGGTNIWRMFSPQQLEAIRKEVIEALREQRLNPGA